MNVEQVRAQLGELFEESIRLRATTEPCKAVRETWILPFLAGAVCMALCTALVTLLLNALAHH